MNPSIYISLSIYIYVILTWFISNAFEFSIRKYWLSLKEHLDYIVIVLSYVI